MGNRNSRFVHNQAYIVIVLLSQHPNQQQLGTIFQSSGTIGVRCFTALVITIYPTRVIYKPSIVRGKESEEDADWELKGKGDVVLCVVAVGFGN